MNQPRDSETGQWTSSGEQFICQDCNFSSSNLNTVKTHKRRTGHSVARGEPSGGGDADIDWETEFSSGFQRETEGGRPIHFDQSLNHHNSVGSRDDISIGQREDVLDSDDDEMPDDEEPGTFEHMGPNEWHPFNNFVHFLMCFLHNGSHNHKISQSVVKVLLLGFKKFTDEVPTLNDVVNFQCDYWEEKLLRKVEIKNGEDFSFISPSGQLAMRLGHPIYSKFERLPYKVDMDSEEGTEREGQSSGKKWWKVLSCRSYLLNDRSLYEGDTFVFPDRVVRIDQFFKNKETVYAQVHTYSEEVNLFNSQSIVIVPHFVNNEQICENIKLEQFSTILSLRERNIDVTLSDFKLTKNADELNFQRQEISSEDSVLAPNVLPSSLDEGVTVVTGINLHLDDTSMNPQSKVWKSATCISQQLAGAPTGPGGWKHGDAGTMLLAVAPAKIMSPIEILESLRPELQILQSGFKAFDYQSQRVVSVKAPIGVMEADLDSQRQITPFKGAGGYSFCHKDLINKDTEVQDEDHVTMRTRENLDEQIQEIENALTQAEKKQLCKQYGLVPERYPPVTDMIENFDLFNDIACDTLHLLLLGVFKKFLIALKERLSEEQLKRTAALVDSVMHPILYNNRPSGNVVLSPHSQIGRSIKALFQVLYFGLNVAGTDQIYSRAAFNLAELSCMLFTESDPEWNMITLNMLEVCIQRCLATLERYFPECISPKAHYVKHHILTDIDNHGNPSSFNCNGGERKMKVEKIAQTYSNKQHTNRDTTRKLLNVEVTKHIVTGGIFSNTGEKCGSGVEEFCRSAPCQDYLGLIKEDIGCKLKLGDWKNKQLVKSRPKREHILAGCPDEISSTWKRVTVDGVKIVRGGGVKFRQRNRSEIVGIIDQIYKNDSGVFVIAKKLIRVRCDDQLVAFTVSSVYDLSLSCVLVENLSSMKPHVLLHACNLEDNPCPFVRSGEKIKLNCVGSGGFKFIHNRVALARFN